MALGDHLAKVGKVTRALRSARTRTRVSTLFTATARDAAGNTLTRKLTVRLRR